MSDVQRNITACWNSAAPSYDAQAGHGPGSDAERAAWRDLLAGVLPPPPAHVLDVGTGTGFLAFRAHELGHRVTGVDLAGDMLARARERAAALDAAPVFEHGDAADPPFAPASFDAIISRHLFWTLREPEESLLRWRRILRPGGRLLIVDGIWPRRDEDRDEAHAPDDEEEQRRQAVVAQFYTEEVVEQLPVRRYTSVDAVIAAITTAGFTNVRPVDLSAVDDAEGHLEQNIGRYALAALRQ
jgi:SAM-dependent methyltransferase